MKRVWNITDGSRFKGQAVTVMLMGKTVTPGSFVSVPDELIDGAHKVAKELSTGAIWVGDILPTWYLQEKSCSHYPFPAGHSRAHGKASPAVALRKEVEAAVEEAVKNATSDTEEETDDQGMFGRKRRRG